MEIIKGILIVIYIIVAIILTVLTLIQSKDDPGLSGAISGSSANNFFEKNKGKTKEGKQKRWTILLGIIFIILSITLGIIYMV